MSGNRDDHGIGQADTGRRLALALRCWGHRGDENQVAVALLFPRLQLRNRYLGNMVPVGQNVISAQAQTSGDIDDAPLIFVFGIRHVQLSLVDQASPTWSRGTIIAANIDYVLHPYRRGY